MVVSALSLLLIGIAAGWYFSCSGDSAMCQITRSFSIGWGIFGLIGLAMGVFTLVEDRMKANAPDPSADERREDR